MPSDLQSRLEPAIQPAPQAGEISLANVSFTYPPQRGRDAVRALTDVSLQVRDGELLAVVGPSGCGKSTLLELLCGLKQPHSGSLRCPPAVLMPQRDLLLPWLDALDNAALALRIAGLSRARARAGAAELFGELGLDGFQRAHPHELSGGMRQRVAFLRTLLSGKRVLCLDEPFGALDAITRGEMQQWLAAALAREPPRTVVLVTHDVEEAVLLADRIVVLGRRRRRVLETVDVTIEHPRARTDRAVLELRERVLQTLSAGAGV